MEVTGTSRQAHIHITPASQLLHTLLTERGEVKEGVFIMVLRKVRWETMVKNNIRVSKLAEHYLITCRLEGKTASTLRGYEEKLGRFVR